MLHFTSSPILYTLQTRHAFLQPPSPSTPSPPSKWPSLQQRNSIGLLKLSLYKNIPTADSRTSKYTGKIVFVTVGSDPESQVFPVHKDVLCEHCPYLGLEFFCGETTTSLPDESPHAFDMVVLWVYEEKVLSALHGEVTDMTLIDTFALASKLEMEQFKNSVTTALTDFYTYDWVTVEGLTRLIQRGLGQSKLRQYIAQKLANDISTYGYPRMCERMPDLKEHVKAGGDDVEELFSLAFGTNSYNNMRGGDVCFWHEHISSPLCDLFNASPKIVSSRMATENIGDWAKAEPKAVEAPPLPESKMIEAARPAKDTKALVKLPLTDLPNGTSRQVDSWSIGAKGHWYNHSHADCDWKSFPPSCKGSNNGNAPVW